MSEDTGVTLDELHCGFSYRGAFLASKLSEEMMLFLGEVWSKRWIYVGLMVEVIAGVGRALEMMLVLPTGRVEAVTDNDRAGQAERVRAGRKEMGRGGKIDGVRERSSITQRLLLCVTILHPG